MKFQVILAFWILFSSVVVFAQPKDGERNVVKVEETKRGKKTITDTFKGGVLIRKQVDEQRTGDRPLEAKYTRYYRDRQEVLFEYWDSKSKETVRYFTQDNRTVMAELDRNGDGVFEWVVFFGKDDKVSTVFKRTADGKMELIEGAALDTFKKGSDTAKELFER
jgi:hypothetical protein